MMKNSNQKGIGVMLINLGSTLAPTNDAVFRFIKDLISEETKKKPFFHRLFVSKILPWLLYKPTRDHYQKIWLQEGSPLLVYGKKVEHALQEALGTGFYVKFATVLNKNSIHDALTSLTQNDLSQLIFLPFFLHYAVLAKLYQKKVMEELLQQSVIPDLTLIDKLGSHPYYIEAIAEIGKKYDLSSYDYILFSFHGLPLKTGQKTLNFYSSQCRETALLIAEKMNLTPEHYTTCFQSRVGKEEWLQPYTSDFLIKLAREGKKRVLIFCPSWVSDCLETLYEVGIDYRERFKEAGGEILELVPCVNDHPKWIEGLRNMILERKKK